MQTALGHPFVIFKVSLNICVTNSAQMPSRAEAKLKFTVVPCTTCFLHYG